MAKQLISDTSAHIISEKRIRELEGEMANLKEDIEGLRTQLAQMAEFVTRQQAINAALVENVEELEDLFDIEQAKTEMERTGEKPIPLLQIKAELGM